MAEIRCTAPHPVHPGTCGAKLADIVPATVVVKAGTSAAPGCVLLKCRRCGAEYLVCPRAA